MERGSPRRLVTVGMACVLASACTVSETAPTASPATSGDIPAAGALVEDLPRSDEVDASVAFGRAMDRQFANQARSAGSVDEAIGAEAETIFEQMDAGREGAMESADEETGVAAGPSASLVRLVASQLGAGNQVALAGLKSAFITTLSPSGLAERVLAWERDQGGELPREEAAVEYAEGPVALLSLRSRGVADGIMTIGAEMTVTLDLPDPPGGTLGETYTGEVEMEVCPDSSGEVAGTLDLSLVSSAQVSGGSATGETTITASATGSVNDEAALANVDIDFDATSRQTSAPTGGQAQGAYGEVAGTMSYVPGSGGAPDQFTADSGRVVHQSSRASDDAVQSLYEFALRASWWIMDDTVAEAEQLWQRGYCVDVRVTEPDGGTKSGVEPDSTHSIVAEAIHRREGGTIDAPIEARMLSGDTSVEPSGERLESPATFTYHAPPERDKTGKVQLRTVSRRGIGEAEASFDTHGGYRLRLTNEYEVTLQIGPGASSSGIGTDVLEGDLDAETLDGVFEARSEGRSTTSLGDIVCTQEWVGTQRLRATGTPTTERGRPEVLMVFTPEGAPDYSVQKNEGGEFCPFDERISASGRPILPFVDSFIIDQHPLPVPGPPREGDPKTYDIPVGGTLDGIFVLAGWHVEWLEP